MKPSFLDRFNTALLQLVPHHPLSKLMYLVTRSETKWLKNLLIKQVVRSYGVNLDEAIDSDPSAYPSFNHFFTRALKSEARPLDTNPGSLVSPVDGQVSQAGIIENGQLIQAKGHNYELISLLAGNERLSSKFQQGSFATLYLSPKDYHRIHIPLDGKLTDMWFVPGKLFSVSDATTQLVPNLFARNERAICLFDTSIGPLAVIFVGAIFVGSMESVWHGELKPTREVTHWSYEDKSIAFGKGDEIGRFNMGSTVILLAPEKKIKWLDSLLPGSSVRMGQSIADLIS